MSKKRCVYKGCSNTSFDKTTLFQFPKNAVKMEKWIHLSGCENNNSKEIKFLCEKHFSPIYVTSSPRRKMLLSSAVPFSYDMKIFEDYADEGTYEYVVVEDDEKEKYEHEEQNKDSEPVPIMEQEEHEIIDKQQDEDLKNQEQEITNNIEEDQNITISTATNNTIEQLQPPNLEQTNNIELQASSTFIFQGTQYIQMPLSAYLDEKNKLISELERYKKILSTFKDELNSIL